MFKKIISIGVLLVMLFSLSGCVDYGYEFHFSVIGGNGSISAEWGGDMSPIILMGNKNGHQLTFTATPDDGYQVKQWTYNGEIVEGNKSNSFTAIVASYKESPVYITVEFELSN